MGEYASKLLESALQYILDPHGHGRGSIRRRTFDCEAMRVLCEGGWHSFAVNCIKEILPPSFCPSQSDPTIHDMVTAVCVPMSACIDGCTKRFALRRDVDGSTTLTSSHHHAKATLELAQQGLQVQERAQGMPWYIGTSPVSTMRLSEPCAWLHVQIQRARPDSEPIIIPYRETWARLKSLGSPLRLEEGMTLCCGKVCLTCRLPADDLHLTTALNETLISTSVGFVIGSIQRGETLSDTGSRIIKRNGRLRLGSTTLDLDQATMKLVLDDDVCSGVHAIVNKIDNRWWLEDTSRNGTYVLLENGVTHALGRAFSLNVERHILRYTEGGV